jgi:hypothetical protein
MANSNVGNTAQLVGWPFVNYAVNLRRWGSDAGGTSTRISINTPRHKHTWFAEFVMGPGVVDMLTNVATFLEDGTLYSNLKKTDLPKPKIVTDKLRGYNRTYNIQKKIEYEPLTMRFYDDSTSMVMALVKDMIAFVNYSGELGGDRRQTNPGTVYNTEFSKFSYNHTGVQALAGNAGDTIRSQMDTRPSLGMKLRECSRMFFESIIIYDLGTEPDSINIYTYYNPSLIAVEPEDRDQGESGVVEVSLIFEYENYSLSTGQPKNAIQGNIDQQLQTGGSPAYAASSGHAQEGAINLGPDPTCMAACGIQGGLSIFTESGGVTFPASNLGSVTDPTNYNVIGTNGALGATIPVSSLGVAIGGTNFGNSSSAALSFYNGQLSAAQISFAQLQSQPGVDPNVIAARQQQINILQGQVNALSQFQNATISGGLATNPDTTSAAANTVAALQNTNGPSAPASTSPTAADIAVQQQQDQVPLALIAAAQSFTNAAALATAQAAAATNPTDAAAATNLAVYYTSVAQSLTEQSEFIPAVSQFATYNPALYGGTSGTNTGGVIAAVTAQVALAAINQYLALNGGTNGS